MMPLHLHINQKSDYDDYGEEKQTSAARKITCISYCLFVCVDVLCPSQQFFSQVGTIISYWVERVEKENCSIIYLYGP